MSGSDYTSLPASWRACVQYFPLELSGYIAVGKYSEVNSQCCKSHHVTCSGYSLKVTTAFLDRL